MTITHDPSEYIKGLLQLLISDKKRIAFLFGAGTSLTNSELGLSVPAIGQLTTDIVSHLEVKNEKFSLALAEIKNELGSHNWNIEKILSNFEQKSALVSGGVLNGLVKSEIDSVIIEIKSQIKEKVSVHSKLESDSECIKKSVHYGFAKWIGQINRKFPIEIFTTNYDFLFECGLEEAQVPYCDGFSGSFEPFFCPEVVEDVSVYPKITKLWKLHGSLGWDYCEKRKRVVKKHHSESKILIYPSHLKYHDSRKQPHVSLIDRIHSFLQQPDAVLITCGYSFGDEHINERILSSLKRDVNSQVISLYYDKMSGPKFLLDDEENHLRKLAEQSSKLSVFGMNSAVIGCKFGEWTLRSEPSKYDTPRLNYFFDEEAPTLSEKMNKEFKGDEKWSGKGLFILPNFARLVDFISAMMISNTGDD